MALTAEQVQEQWSRIAEQSAELVERLGREEGFAVNAGSTLADDDKVSSPYAVSHVVRLNLSVAIDHLHALCVLVLESGFLHLAAPDSLARGALERAAAAIWMTCPTDQDERVRRALRWHAQDFSDGDRAAKEMGASIPTPLKDRIDKLVVVADRFELNKKALGNGYSSTEAVKAVDQHLSGSPIRTLVPWRLASGYAHGRRWPFLGFAEFAQRLPTTDRSVTLMKLENDYEKLFFSAWAAETTVTGAVALFDRLRNGS